MPPLRAPMSRAPAWRAQECRQHLGAARRPGPDQHVERRGLHGAKRRRQRHRGRAVTAVQADRVLPGPGEEAGDAAHAVEVAAPVAAQVEHQPRRRGTRRHCRLRSVSTISRSAVRPKRSSTITSAASSRRSTAVTEGTVWTRRIVSVSGWITGTRRAAGRLAAMSRAAQRVPAGGQRRSIVAPRASGSTAWRATAPSRRSRGASASACAVEAAQSARERQYAGGDAGGGPRPWSGAG